MDYVFPVKIVLKLVALHLETVLLVSEFVVSTGTKTSQKIWKCQSNLSANFSCSVDTCDGANTITNVSYGILFVKQKV